jgi:ACT domain-containing protein
MEMMVIATAVVAIVLIAGISINGIVDKVMQGKRLRFEASAGGDQQSTAQIRDIAERQQMIEDRLRVLERIATDRGNLLAEEIEALRGAGRALPLVGGDSRETA